VNVFAARDRERRERLWDASFVTCTKHPERRCQRSYYVRRGCRRCNSCKNGARWKTEAYRIYHRWYLRSYRRYRAIQERKI